ncbi:hypothetical protein K492DRAFT_135798, partial [Lichtheimia hyalospora FSU 10163]
IAPRIVVVFALVCGTTTSARVPFFDHAIVLLRLMWKADSSMKTQFLRKSISVCVQ